MQTDRQTDRERQTDRQTDMTKLIIAFRNVANAPIQNLNTHILDVIRTRAPQFHYQRHIMYNVHVCDCAVLQ
jgi:hypothetical protein